MSLIPSRYLQYMNEFTEQRLENALDRLLAGTPEKTKADGRISIKRVNDEAGLSRGAIYYYKDFVEKAKIKIAEFKKNKVKSAPDNEPAPVKISATTKINHEKELKDNYREQLALEKQSTDMLLQMNITMAYRCLELEKEVTTLNKTNITQLPIR